MSKKIKLIFLPYLLAIVLFVPVYTFLDWLLVIKYQVLDLSDALAVYILPLIISTIIVFGALAPRINLLKDYVKNGKSMSFFYKFISIAILGGPVIFSQLYIQKNTGKLTQLNYVSEINNTAPTKYYTVSKFYASKNGIGSCYSTWKSRGYKYPNTIHVYITIPLYDEAKDTCSPKNICGWLLNDQFNETIGIPERLGPDTVKRAFERFFSESIDSFYKNPIPNFVYLERFTDANRISDDCIYAVKRSTQYVNGNPITLLYPRNEPFDTRAQDDLGGVIFSFVAGMFIILVILMAVDFDTAKFEQYEATKKFPRKPYI